MGRKGCVIVGYFGGSWGEERRGEKRRGEEMGMGMGMVDGDNEWAGLD